MLLPDRAEVAQLARRWRIEGYEIDDVVQEIYLAILTGIPYERHLETLKKREYRKRCRETPRPLTEEDPAWLAASDVGTLTEHDIDATCLRIACESECRNSKDKALLKSITAGADYDALKSELKCSINTAAQRVCRFRKHLHSRIFPKED